MIGERQLDSNWFHGRCNNASGIFPVTHVKLLNTVTSQSSLHPASDNTTITGDFIAKAVANMDVTAQIDDELEFCKGDVIDIVKAVDSEFAIGECNGRSGMFALAFVNIIEGQLNQTSTPSPGRQRKSKFRWWEREEDDVTAAHDVEPASCDDNVYMSINSCDMNSESRNTTTCASDFAPTDQTYEPTLELSLHENPTNNTSVPDSSSHDNTTSVTDQNSKKTHARVGSYTEESLRSFDTTMVPYARTLYPFVAERSNELTFSDNEIVTLLQHVDDSWIEGEIDGKRGMFPASYVEIIIDCNRRMSSEDAMQAKSDVTNNTTPLARDNSFQESVYCDIYEDINANAEAKEAPESYAYGSVLYDYVTDEGTALSMGDAINILRQVDENWFLVQKDATDQPIHCPVTYVDVLSVCPIPGAPTSSVTSTLDTPSVSEPHPTPKEPQVREKAAETNTKAPPKKPAITKPKPALRPKPQILEKQRPASAFVSKQSEPTSTSHGGRQSPKVSVFASNRALRTSSNLDEIIQSQMHLTRQQSQEQKPAHMTRSASASVATTTAPPIPDRKNLQKRPQHNNRESSSTASPPVPVTWSKADRSSEKRVASSTFYTAQHTNTTSSSHRSVTSSGLDNTSKRQVPVPLRPAPPRPTGVKRRQNLIEFSPEKENSQAGIIMPCFSALCEIILLRNGL